MCSHGSSKLQEAGCELVLHISSFAKPHEVHKDDENKKRNELEEPHPVLHHDQIVSAILEMLLVVNDG